LDGETNLKIRKALERTWDYLTPEKAAEFKGYFGFAGHLLNLKVILGLQATNICIWVFLHA
jgi:hypothetical protein